MNTQDVLGDALRSAISAAVSTIASEESAAAAKRVEQRIRAEAGKIAIRAMNWQRMEMRGNEVVITIQIPPTPR